MTPRKPDGSRVEDWIRPLNVSGRYGRVTSANKEMVDICAVRDDFRPSFLAEFNVTLDDIRPGADPPDIVARIDDREVSIELVELLHKDVREKKAQGLPVGWDEQQWSQPLLVSRLQALIDKKDAIYSRRSDKFVADALLIVCDELWLPRDKLDEWLEPAEFQWRDTIRSVYFGVSMLPNNPTPYCLLYRLYGDLS